MDEKDRKLIRMLGALSTVGLTLVFATVIGLFIGLKLDAWLGTSPWLTAVFLVIGIIAGFKNLFVYVKRSQKTFDENDDKKKHDV
jgi:F0F1-type ATP synthase assembly protein I